MQSPSQTQPSTTLSPDDLKALEKYVAAWCAENAVSRDDPRAEEVASALLGLFQADAQYRRRVQIDALDDLPIPPEIQHLLRQIT